MSRSVKKKPAGNTPPRQFRLGEDVMERLQVIADHLTRETGVDHSRADAIRVIAKEKADAIGQSRGAK